MPMRVTPLFKEDTEIGYFDTASEYKPLLHLWSLSIEEQFYLLWPAILITLRKLNMPIRISLTVMAIASFSLNIYHVSTNQLLSFYLPFTRFWELALGGILYGNIFANYFDKHRFLNNTLPLIGLSLIAIAIISFDSSSKFPGWLALIPTSGAALIIMSSGNSLINNYLLNSKLFVFIGLISYPLYLWHWPILSFIRMVEINGIERAHKIVAICLSLVLAWLTYRYIEKPVRFSKNPVQNLSLLLVICILAIGCTGFFTFYQKGFTFRYPQEELAAEQLRLSDAHGIQGVNCSDFNINEAYGLYGCFIDNKERNPTVIAIGDSHALWNTVGLVDYYNRIGENLSIIFKGGCLPYYGIEGYKKESEVCNKFMTSALDFAVTQPSIKTVILVNRGPFYLTGHSYKNDTIKVTLDLKDSNLNDSQKIFEQGLRMTVDSLTKAGKNIILIIDNPELGFKPSTCIKSRPLTFKEERINELCAEPISEVNQRNLVYREILGRVLKDYPAIETLDASRYLCDDSLCFGKLNNEILYYDDNHLSKAGTRFIGDMFAGELDKRSNSGR